MCCSIKIVYFGCSGDDQHVEHAVVRCKGGLEYILLMPVEETCRGVKSVEDWRMTPCRFCEEYVESRKSSGPLGGHFRAVSLPTNVAAGVEELVDSSDSEWDNFTRASPVTVLDRGG